MRENLCYFIRFTVLNGRVIVLVTENVSMQTNANAMIYIKEWIVHLIKRQQRLRLANRHQTQKMSALNLIRRKRRQALMIRISVEYLQSYLAHFLLS